MDNTQLKEYLVKRLATLNAQVTYTDHEESGRWGAIGELERLQESIESTPVPIVPKILIEIRKSANSEDRYAPFYLRIVNNGEVTRDRETWYKTAAEAKSIATTVQRLVGAEKCVVKEEL